jgi:hypothetical protein
MFSLINSLDSSQAQSDFPKRAEVDFENHHPLIPSLPRRGKIQSNIWNLSESRIELITQIPRIENQ